MLRKYSIVFIVLLQICISFGAHVKSKRVCVIGAGIAGISSARYLKEEGIDFTVFESTRYIGGTWRYDTHVGTDENGQPLHTSMYKYLRTNLPKAPMEMRGFPLPDYLPSYPTGRDFYHYLEECVDRLDIRKYIKFLHAVVSVRRINDVWKVKYEHVVTKEIFEEDFDYIIVGNGHFSKPSYPNIPGEDLFTGRIIHSHDYKAPEPFTNRRVLVVGAGPSGMDIGLEVADVASALIHSHHSKINWTTPFPPHYHKKPDIKEFNETGVIFEDGSFEEIDDVIYCTGFYYDFPFLDESSGLTMEPKSVVPLYRYTVNINQPSMFIMGAFIRACLVVALDAQARYATAYIKGNFSLPTRDEMMLEWQKRMDTIRSKGLPTSYIHILGEKEDEFYAELTRESGIERVPPVMFKIRTMDTEAKIENLYTYRNYAYTVIDDHTFVRKVEDPAIRKGMHEYGLAYMN
ncbi:senecionine N-oxygenase isoform X1 [Helicoverpa armigera]|uniref:senecionine N-oxygenase isoform X1 n=2 Tax=Helicoverpa armigera TaxID=29058 RepID=UPI00308357B9